MPKLTFFNLGNADSCRIDLDGGQKILFDFGNQGDSEDSDDLRCDLADVLKEDLRKSDRNYFNVVAITHLDKDHYQGASEFFYLEHEEKYQDDDRIRINTLWVPAAVITEESVSDSEGRIIQAEAQHRLREGKGIRVFSRPAKLKEWLEKQGLELEDRKHLITDAGKLAPEFTLREHGAELFVHSPFAKRLNEEEVEDRNDNSIIMQVTFECEGVQTKVIMGSDASHEVLADIVNVTRGKGNDKRLEWDIVKLPHHCSYLSLGPEKGDDKTDPVKELKWLYKEKSQSQEKGIIVSSSKPIPVKGSDEDESNDPPHRQAANYYRSVIDKENFKVTMEHPEKKKPEPLIIEISRSKATIKKTIIAGGGAVISQPAPRAGQNAGTC